MQVAELAELKVRKGGLLNNAMGPWNRMKARSRRAGVTIKFKDKHSCSATRHWTARTCRLVRDDDELREFVMTPEAQALLQAVKLVGSVVQNQSWMDQSDPNGRLKGVLEELIHATATQ